MSTLLLRPYPTKLVSGSVSASRLRRRQATTRNKDATPNGGANHVRRIYTVRASSSGDPRREHKQGLDLRRGDSTRLEWQWNDFQETANSWSNSNPLDRDVSSNFTLSSSEAWDCYGPHTSQGTAGNGDASIEEVSSDANSTMTPEQEIHSLKMKRQPATFNYVNLMDAEDSSDFGDQPVYVLLFGVGEATTEGIYSLRSHCHETGLHNETIICFESSEDAARFSGLLEASMPHVSTVHTIRSSELIQFCSNSGYECRLELDGSTLMPPEFNVGITDWERSMKLRQGQYQVLENEPTYGDVQDTDSVSNSNLPDGISSQLDEVRSMLERLLPED